MKADILVEINWLSDKLDERLPKSMEEEAIQNVALAVLAFKRLAEMPNGDKLRGYAHELAKGLREVEKRVELQ